MFQKRFLTSIFLIVGVTATILYAPKPFFMGMGTLLVIIALKEFYAMMDDRGLRPLLFFGTFSGVVLYNMQFVVIQYPWLEKSMDLSSITVFMIVFGTFFTVLSRFGKVPLIACISTTLTGIFYVAWLFSYIVKIRYFEAVQGNWLLLFFILVTKSTDMAAYCIGKLMGKTKLIPAVSPNKTLEGAIGGMIGSLLIGIAFYEIWRVNLAPLQLTDIVILCIVLGFFSQIGDILESALKRDAGVKDSGIIIPGMGGVLDVMDSLLITAPIMYFYMLLRTL